MEVKTVHPRGIDHTKLFQKNVWIEGINLAQGSSQENSAFVEDAAVEGLFEV